MPAFFAAASLALAATLAFSAAALWETPTSEETVYVAPELASAPVLAEPEDCVGEVWAPAPALQAVVASRSESMLRASRFFLGMGI